MSKHQTQAATMHGAQGAHGAVVNAYQIIPVQTLHDLKMNTGLL
jgi:hypothetical protein